VVDDDPAITAVFKEGIEAFGFTVDAFNDPVEALQNFQHSRFQ
jgi:CheY-like chemotaxis protein